jgi:hypothetical protein
MIGRCSMEQRFVPVDDSKSFWGALGCSCWAV